MRNKLLFVGIPILFLGLVLISLAMVIKPGASIFFYKIKLDPNQFELDEGYAFRFPVRVNTYIFPAKVTLLFEADQQLHIGTSNEVVEIGQGAYFLTDPMQFKEQNSSQDGYYLYFSASDNSDPRTNGHLYRLYLPVSFFSQGMGLVYLALLGVILARFIYVSLHLPGGLRLNLGSADSFTAALCLSLKLPDYFGSFQTKFSWSKHRSHKWGQIFLWALLSAYSYVVMEWLFFTTKPSFMDLFGWGERTIFLFQAGLFLALPGLLSSFLLWLLDTILAKLNRSGVPLLVAVFIPALVLACSVLLLVDNFTYTLFRWGVVSTEGVWRGVYAGVFLVGLFFIYRNLLARWGLLGQTTHLQKLPLWLVAILGGFTLVSLVLVLARFDRSGLGVALVSETQRQELPNIILLGSDGLNAANLSMYGYERGTTPTIDRLAETSLVAQNAFTNATNSSGSVISIFTGKLPMQTRVYYPTNVLQEVDSFQHLPGILQRLGYYNVEMGVTNYVDAYNANLQDGFDFVNDRSEQTLSLFQPFQGYGYDESLYFGMQMGQRISERLQHIFLVKEMINPYSEVTRPTNHLSDSVRLDTLLGLIQGSQDPFFIHVHMMGTHGPIYNPLIEKYSLGQTQDEGWMMDFYDDSILTYDSYVAEVLEALELSGKMDDTVLILYSDHAKDYTAYVRIPLLIHFPNGQYARQIQANVQNLDIAPTLLDYMGLSIPDWMPGVSLLRGEPAPNRLIFVAGGRAVMSEGELVVDKETPPPFYQFGMFRVIQCQRWYQYDVRSARWASGEVNGHTAPCSPDMLLTQTEIQQALADLLEGYGYDASSLR